MPSTPSSVFPVSQRFRGGVLKSISASSSTGLGKAFDLRGGYTGFAARGVGPSTAWRGSLLGSVDGSRWFSIKAAIGASTAGAAPTASTTTYPVQFVRLQTTTKTTAAGKQVTAYIIVKGA